MLRCLMWTMERRSLWETLLHLTMLLFQSSDVVLEVKVLLRPQGFRLKISVFSIVYRDEILSLISVVKVCCRKRSRVLQASRELFLFQLTSCGQNLCAMLVAVRTL